MKKEKNRSGGKQNLPIYIIMALMAGILAVSAVFLGQRMLQYHQGTELYNDAAEILPVEEPEVADPYDACLMQLRSLDLSGTLEASEDVAGWIVIPGTKVSYPLVQGNDNDYYLNHTYNGKSNVVGAIFADSRNRIGLGSAWDVSALTARELLPHVKQGQVSGLPDFNTIIYGHRMKNGSMFASLKYYRDLQYYEEHPYVGLALVHRSAHEAEGGPEDGNGAEISTEIIRKDPLTTAPDGAYIEQRGDLIYTYYVLSVFSAFTADTTSDEAAESTYVINPGSPEEQNRAAALWKNQSVIETGVTPAEGSRIITLSTCSGGGNYSTRWVVKCCTSWRAS